MIKLPPFICKNCQLSIINYQLSIIFFLSSAMEISSYKNIHIPPGYIVQFTLRSISVCAQVVDKETPSVWYIHAGSRGPRFHRTDHHGLKILIQVTHVDDRFPLTSSRTRENKGNLRWNPFVPFFFINFALRIPFWNLLLPYISDRGRHRQ